MCTKFQGCYRVNTRSVRNASTHISHGQCHLKLRKQISRVRCVEKPWQYQNRINRAKSGQNFSQRIDLLCLYLKESSNALNAAGKTWLCFIMIKFVQVIQIQRCFTSNVCKHILLNVNMRLAYWYDLGGAWYARKMVSHKSEMAGIFSRGDTIIYETFTFAFYSYFIFLLVSQITCS
jgi:hypothetical protein